MISEAQLQSSGNNFTLARFLLSAAVVFSHSFDLSLGHGGSDPLFPWLGQASLSLFAVNGFFFLSGFLVTGSFIRQPSAILFSVARAARILPGYAINLILTSIVLGLLVSSFSIAAYFQMAESWSYIAKNIIPIKMQGTLPGVFEANPYPLAVNGSLWTIPFEMLCYAVLCVLGIWGGLTDKKVFLLSCGAFAVLQILWWTIGSKFAIEHGFSERIGLLFRLSLNFYLGVIAYYYRSWIKIDWRYFVTLSIAAAIYIAIGFRTSLADELLRAAFAGYFVLCLSFETSRRLFRRFDSYDISFGLYIYAFPIQQTLYWIDPLMAPVTNMGMTFAIAVPLATLSWLFIERPALNFVKELRRRRSAKSSSS